MIQFNFFFLKNHFFQISFDLTFFLNLDIILMQKCMHFILML